MTFRNLRANNQVYVLFKGDTYHLEMGTVTYVSPLRPPMNIGSFEWIIDITVKVNDKDYQFTKLRADADTAETNYIFVSITKEGMNTELIALCKKSTDVINSIDVHKKIFEQCDAILKKLNPELVAQKRQEEELKTLRTQASEMKESMERLMEQFKK